MRTRRSPLAPKVVAVVSSLLSLAVLAAGFAWSQQPAVKPPPPSRTDNVREVLHGVEIVDPYRWLEDQESAESRGWIEAQNSYTRSILDALPGRERLAKRIGKLLKVDTQGLPVEMGGRYFLTKRLAEQELPVICVRKGLKGKDEVLLDPHPMSPDHSVSVSLSDISTDGALVAYGVRKGGDDQEEIRLLEVDPKRPLPDVLPKALYFGVQIKPDRGGLYYARMEKDGPIVRYHAMGTDPASDPEVFGKGYGPDKGIDIALSPEGRYLALTVSHGSAADRTEIYVQNLEKKGPIVPVVNDLAARFLGAVAGDTLYIQTNWEAPRGRIMAVGLADGVPSDRQRWREVVAQREAVIEAFVPACGRLLVSTLENASSRLLMFGPSGEDAREIPLEGIGSVAGLTGRWEGTEFFFGFSSFHVPFTIHRYDVASSKQEMWWRVRIPVRSSRFETKQVWFNSKDGTRVPMFVVHEKGIKLDGTRPALLTGYGGFNISETPYFSSYNALWIEQGGVLALPNLRGGGEFGEEWHRAGMLDKKQNTFDDFIAAAEWLIKNGYTSPARLAIRGGSNGGLLVGAALAQRPELFRAVICTYPLLDMLRFHKFLVAQFWVSEYGSSDDPGQFDTIRAYSPYHNIVKGTKYPAVLFVTGDSDTRVAPLHARKMTALLQAATGSDRPVMLRYDTKAGHVGADPVGKKIEEITDEISFLLWQMGLSS